VEPLLSPQALTPCSDISGTAALCDLPLHHTYGVMSSASSVSTALSASPSEDGEGDQSFLPLGVHLAMETSSSIVL
jgi:hypothetical protein